MPGNVGMNKVRLCCWLVVPITLGAFAFLALGGRSWLAAVTTNPLMEYPATLDLGEREVGDVVVTPFTIANRGGSDLVIDQIQTNCSCAGLERRQDGHFVRLDSFRLKAGEKAELVVRLSVPRLPVGTPMNTVIEFRTNDPKQQTGCIELRVRRILGGVLTSPESVVFGTVATGAEVRQTVNLLDKAPTRRTVDRVTTSVPGRVLARLLPGTEPLSVPKPEGDYVIVGRVEVTVLTGTPGYVSAEVHIHLAGETRKPDVLTVVGKVAAPVEVLPSQLILPRASSKGPVYDALCICQSSGGKPLTVTLESAPNGLAVELLAQESESRRAIRVTWDPKKGDVGRGQRHVIRFRAEAGQDSTIVELPVLIQP